MNRKAILILAVIFILILGTVGALVFMKYGSGNKTADQTDTTDEIPVDTEPVDGEPVDELPVDETPPGDTTSSAQKFFTDLAISPSFLYDGSGIAFMAPTGTLVQLKLLEARPGELVVAERKEYELPPKANIRKILWQPFGDDFIVEREEDGRVRYSVYLYRRQQFVDLPEQVQAVDWVPRTVTQGALEDPDILSEIVYLWKDPEGQVTLNVAAADNSRYELLTDIWEPDNDLSLSPDGRSVLFWRTQSQDAINRINMVSADGKFFRTILKEGYNSGALWSPDNRTFLFVRLSDSAGVQELYLANIFTNDSGPLDIRSNLDKAFWASPNILYIAGSDINNPTSDQLYRFDLTKDADPEIFDLGVDVDVSDLIVSPEQTYAVFKDRLSQSLYYYFLPKAE